METVTISLGTTDYVRVCEGASFVMVDTPAEGGAEFVFATSHPAPDVDGYKLPVSHRHRFTDLEVVDLFLRAYGDPVDVVVTRSI